MLTEVAGTVREALVLVQEVRDRFRNSYRAMLRTLASVGKPTAVCTISDSIPGLGSAERAALGGFNEVILREAFSAGLPVIDLRSICDRPEDYSHVSRIEPSAVGGAKIARAITEALTAHDFGQRRSAVYL